MKGLKTYICFTIVILSALAFVLTSCGGGGGAGGGGGSNGGASLTNANAPQAASAAGQSVAFVQSTNFVSTFDLSGNVGPESISSKTSKSFSKSLLKNILNKTMSISKIQRHKSEIHTAGSMPTTTVECFDSGTITISNAKWTDDPEDDFNLINLSATITAANCKEDPYLWNGSMSIALVGSSYEPTKITTVSKPTFTSTNTDINETITMTNLTTVIDLSEFGETEAITLTGTISGQVDGEPINVECKNFKIEFIDEETVSLSGEIKPTCLGGWVTVNTHKPIFTETGADCPTAGEVILTSGANSVKIVIAADSKIYIYYNNTLVGGKPYDSCNDIAGLCEG
ncbi:MAG: hypothetical protein FJ240_02105 [Nitrospira sp.]|nr:hypothetical protein [Nitrospira sp.]